MDSNSEDISLRTISPAQAADILGVSPATLVDWADKGYLPVIRYPSGYRRFRESDVRALVAQMTDDREAS